MNLMGHNGARPGMAPSSKSHQMSHLAAAKAISSVVLTPWRIGIGARAIGGGVAQSQCYGAWQCYGTEVRSCRASTWPPAVHWRMRLCYGPCGSWCAGMCTARLVLPSSMS